MYVVKIFPLLSSLEVLICSTEAAAGVLWNSAPVGAPPLRVPCETVDKRFKGLGEVCTFVSLIPRLTDFFPQSKKKSVSLGTRLYICNQPMGFI